MGKSIALVFLALFAISLLHQTSALSMASGSGHHHKKTHNNSSGTLSSSECPSQCSRRCSKTQYHKPCMFFCQKCCKKCLCVPPGFYGNKNLCPCYNNWKTKQGGPKCP